VNTTAGSSLAGRGRDKFAKGTRVNVDRVWELRQYTLFPGRRDDLVDVFDRWFLESQEDLGMCVQGQFYDLDRPDRFVWLRSFPDLPTRRAALEGFYGGPVWAAHRDVANATMMNSDDVLLLRPMPLDGVEVPIDGRSDPAPGNDRPLVGKDRPLVGNDRSPVGSTDRPGSLFGIDVHQLAPTTAAETVKFFTTEVQPFLAAAGSAESSLLVTEPGPNDFPALPVREGEQVIVRVARFDDEPAHAAYLTRLARSDGWAQVEAELNARLVGPSQRLRLRPTARSRLR
jgi:hypothetical protein